MKINYTLLVFIVSVLTLDYCFAKNMLQNNESSKVLLTKNLGMTDTLILAKDKFCLFDFGRYYPYLGFSKKYGSYLSFQKYFNKRFSIGISLQEIDIEDEITCDIIDTSIIINEGKTALLLEYAFVLKKRFQISCLLMNGLAETSIIYSSQEIKKRNYFISPLVNFSMILFLVKEHYIFQVLLFTKVGYSGVFNNKLICSEVSNGIFGQFGLRFIIRTGEEYPFQK
jgi:hypothetical protein